MRGEDCSLDSGKCVVVTYVTKMVPRHRYNASSSQAVQHRLGTQDSLHTLLLKLVYLAVGHTPNGLSRQSYTTTHAEILTAVAVAVARRRLEEQQPNRRHSRRGTASTGDTATASRRLSRGSESGIESTQQKLALYTSRARGGSSFQVKLTNEMHGTFKNLNTVLNYSYV